MLKETLEHGSISPTRAKHVKKLLDTSMGERKIRTRNLVQHLQNFPHQLSSRRICGFGVNKVREDVVKSVEERMPVHGSAWLPTLSLEVVEVRQHRSSRRHTSKQTKNEHRRWPLASLWRTPTRHQTQTFIDKRCQPPSEEISLAHRDRRK